MQRKKFPFLVTPPHILPPVKPSMLRYWIFDWKIFGKNTFYKICSKHGPDAKKNYFVFSIIDGGGESKPQWWKFHHLFFFFYSAPSLRDTNFVFLAPHQIDALFQAKSMMEKSKYRSQARTGGSAFSRLSQPRKSLSTSNLMLNR